MDFKELETFISIVEKGSISAAAAALGVSQPAVSKRVARLEEEMRAILFAKGHRHSALTPEGSVFYKSALKMLDMRKKTRLQIAEISQDLTGSVIISASSVPGDFILPELLVAFTENYPGVTVTVETSDSQSALEALADKKADIAVIGSDRCLPGYTSIPFFEDELVLIVNRNHPMATRSFVELEDVANLKLVGRSHGSGTRQVWERMYKNRMGTVKDIDLQFGHALGVVGAVAAGAEAGIISRYVAGTSSNVVALPFKPSLHRPFRLVYGLCESRAAEVFISHLLRLSEQQ